MRLSEGKEREREGERETERERESVRRKAKHEGIATDGEKQREEAREREKESDPHTVLSVMIKSLLIDVSTCVFEHLPYFNEGKPPLSLPPPLLHSLNTTLNDRKKIKKCALGFQTFAR